VRQRQVTAVFPSLMLPHAASIGTAATAPSSYPYRYLRHSSSLIISTYKNQCIGYGVASALLPYIVTVLPCLSRLANRLLFVKSPRDDELLPWLFLMLLRMNQSSAPGVAGLVAETGLCDSTPSL
jgi:hypothetical protein